MRIYEDDYAYEVERLVDPATQIPYSWRYNVYRIRPADQLLRSGESKTKDGAEKEGKRVLDEVRNSERGNDGARGKRVA